MSNTYQDLTFTTFPDEIQNFITSLDILASDAEALNNYQQAMRDGNYQLAQTYLLQIPNWNNKIIDANKINTLIDTCVALERFYKNDIMPYINQKEIDFKNEIDKFIYKGDYNNSISYSKNNFVSSNINEFPQLFLCIKDADGISLENTTYWRPITFRGPQGVSGETLSFRGEWSSLDTYYIEDVVFFDNKIWNCIQQNTNQEPILNSSYWNLLYTGEQFPYPFSETAPTTVQNGDLWFQIVN